MKRNRAAPADVVAEYVFCLIVLAVLAGMLTKEC
jgi:hypothetical protein